MSESLQESFERGFLRTESFEESRARILDELFGGPTSEVLPECEHAHLIAASLDAARHSFLDAYRIASATSVSPLCERWLLQESHAGQRRPVQTVLNGKHVLYKPRSLGADIAWTGLIDWFSGCLEQQISAEYDLTDHGQFGWAGVVEHRACMDAADVSRYYERLGMLAALAWAVGSSDATASNVVSAGSLPTWIDTETALIPGNELFAADPAVEFRRCGIAPFSAPDAKGREITFGAAVLKGRLCAHSRSANARDRCVECHSLPKTAGAVHFIQQFERSLCDGFHRGLRALHGAAGKLRAASSPLSAFEQVHGRVVARPSAAYALVREWMFKHKREEGAFPDVLRLLGKLPYKFDLGPGGSSLLVAAEFAALSLGDLPRFEASMSDRTFKIDGNAIVEFSFSAFERARGRIDRLSESMIEQIALAWNRYVSTAILMT